MPHTADESRQVVVEIERHRLGVAEDVLIEGHTEPHIDGVDALQSHQQSVNNADEKSASDVFLFFCHILLRL